MTSSPKLPPLLRLFAVLCLCVLRARAEGGEEEPGPNAGAGGMPDFGQNQVCQPFSCSKPYVPVNKWPLAITSTGCQAGGGVSMFSMGGEGQYKHVEHCCDQKNACYQLCGSNKQACDAELKKCMDRGCDELAAYTSDEKEGMGDDALEKEKEECSKMKGIVELLGTMGGCAEFENHQRGHCECVEKDKLEAKMERVLRAFYKKFNPEGVEKVKGLLEKAGGKRSVFNKILYGMVKKYPAAIKKQKLAMPDAMRDMKMDL